MCQSRCRNSEAEAGKPGGKLFPTGNNGRSFKGGRPMIKSVGLAIMAIGAATIVGAGGAWAQQPPPQAPNMTFFVTSVGSNKGADLGGLEGADKQCQTLAQNAGAG